MVLDQTRLPLQTAIRRFREEAPAFFRIPSHHFAEGADPESRKLLGDAAFDADLTEAEGLDDLHAAEGVIAEAQELAADLFGSKECRFLVNGSTSGNMAMLLSTVGPGSRVLVARNTHQSVLHGLILSGGMPVWLQPAHPDGWILDGAVTAEQVQSSLAANPDCKAVFITSPTYYGICSPLREIADICHAYNIPLLVDEAHGSHMYFSEKAPEGAVQAGADLVVQSLHKTGGSLTQSSLLHRCSERVDSRRLCESIRLVTSSSPSYILMASLDGARHHLALHGRELLHKAEKMAGMCRDMLKSVEGIRVLSIPDLDPLRIVFTAASHGISGIRMQQELYKRTRVSVELSDLLHVVCVISWGNTEEEILRLTETVKSIIRNAEPDLPEDTASVLTKATGCPEVNISPREAWYAERENIPLSAACGRTAAESVIPYPPGIPLIHPGEVFSRDIVDQLRLFREYHIPLQGAADRSVSTICVIK